MFARLTVEFAKSQRDVTVRLRLKVCAIESIQAVCGVYPHAVYGAQSDARFPSDERRDMSAPTANLDAPTRTPDRRASRRAAAARLLVYGLAVAACVAAAQTAGTLNSFAKPVPPTRGDIRLYWDVVNRMRAGERYYAAMHAELQRHGYPSASVFNWRTPPALWLMARLPEPVDGTTLMFCAAALLTVAGFLVQKRELGAPGAYAGGFLMLGAVLPCFVSDLCVLPLEWGAVCVGLSLCCTAWGCTGVAVLLGTLAAFFSELTLGYALLMAVVAAWNGLRRELTLWTAGLLVFGVCFAWHAGMVSRTTGSTEVVDARAWLQFGGLPFLVATAQMNCWLLPLPPWLAAIYLPSALLGLTGWNSETGRRCGLFAAACCMLFLCVGQPFNQYWGLLLALPLAWGAARAPCTLRDLWLVAAGNVTSRTAGITGRIGATGATAPPVV
jgi:hypothetical protein